MARNQNGLVLICARREREPGSAREGGLNGRRIC
jgi:hypothetical protein